MAVSFHASPSVEERFLVLAEQWRRGTAYVSDAGKLLGHPAYRAIVAMGSAVVPVLLREMARRPGDWSSALHEITGADPVAPDDYGRLDRMAAAWVQWGRQHGYAL